MRMFTFCPVYIALSVFVCSFLTMCLIAEGESGLPFDSTSEPGVSCIYRGSGDPAPDVRVNGLADPVQVGRNVVLSLSVSLDPGDAVGMAADWWVVAKAPDGWYYFSYTRGSWIRAGDSYDDLSVTYQGPLFALGTYTLLKVTDLPEGYYIFYFGVDTVQDGAITFSSLCDDRIVVLRGGRPNWLCQRADENSYVGVEPSIALDSNDNQHISHYDDENGDLKYARRVGGVWKNEVVDAAGDVGRGSGIAVDADGNPHISYIDTTNNAVKYATPLNGGWVIEKVYEPADTPLSGTSIALDSNGRPCIVFDQGAVAPVRYASWDGSAWNIEIVYGGGSGAYLAVHDDVPHVSFVGDEGGIMRLHHAAKEQGAWKTEIVAASTEAGGDTGIAVDSNGHPHIVYRDYGNGAVSYARWDGAAWDLDVVEMNAGNGEGVAIAVDGRNTPHIAFADFSSDRLKYAVRDGNTWSIEIVKRLAKPAIAVDKSNHPHIAHRYTDETELEFGVLKYSYRP
jgi:hypothetical protein